MNNALRSKLREHGLAILTISALFVIGSKILTPDSDRPDPPEILRPFVDQPFLHLDDPLHFTLLTDALGYDQAAADSIRREYALWKERLTLKALEERNRQSLWDPGVMRRLIGMGFQFAIIYILVLAAAYFGTRALGTYQFCRLKSGGGGRLSRLMRDATNWPTGDPKKIARYVTRLLKHGGGLVAITAALLVAFSPAYVPAYALKSYVATDSLLLMIVLAVGTNGLLVAYAQKYASLLSVEFRKGYVETAMVKGLSSDFKVRWTWIVRGQFRGHVLGHVVENADYQYWSTFKEQASFIVTGLVIIEMALNMQGRLCYEMLQQMLYRNADIVFAIMMGLFLLIKCTEAAVDVWTIRLHRKYDNAD